MSVPALFDRLRLPVIAVPLFIISNPELVIAQCRAGVVGSFPALNARPASTLDEWLRRFDGELGLQDAPYAVNQVVHRSNDRLMHDVELCVKYRAPIVITSLGAREDVNQMIHSYGGIWGSGQGVGAVQHVVSAQDLVARLAQEYAAARARLGLHA